MKNLNLDLYICLAERITRQRIRFPLALVFFLFAMVLFANCIDLVNIYPKIAFAMGLVGCWVCLFTAFIWCSNEPEKFVSRLRSRRHFKRWGYLPHDPVI